MTFTEVNTVEQMILDTVTRKRRSERSVVREAPPGRARLTVTLNRKPEEGHSMINLICGVIQPTARQPHDP